MNLNLFIIFVIFCINHCSDAERIKILSHENNLQSVQHCCWISKRSHASGHPGFWPPSKSIFCVFWFCRPQRLRRRITISPVHVSRIIIYFGVFPTFASNLKKKKKRLLKIYLKEFVFRRSEKELNEIHSCWSFWTARLYILAAWILPARQRPRLCWLLAGSMGRARAA